MNRTGVIFSLAVVLSIFTFVACYASEDGPVLNRTTTGFTIVHPESKKSVKVLLTFNQDRTLYKIERCLPDKPCEEIKTENLGYQNELYSCAPLKDGERPSGTKVTLKNPHTGKDQPYDCQYITATEPNEPVIFKAGENTSCPFIINGRYYDPCRGIF
jgi:hypothetical protein